MKYKSKLLYKLGAVTIFCCFLLLRLTGIFTDMSNSDAWRWHSRSEDFYQGIKTGNLKETYQRYHPGVTLMWLSSFVRVGLSAYAKIGGTEYKSLENVEGYILQDGLSKCVLVLCLLGLLIYQFRLINKMYGTACALVFGIFMSTEPYLVGIDRWYHITSLEAYLSFAAFLSVLYWKQNKSNRSLIHGGIFLGLALLTRFSSIIVGVLCFPMLYAATRGSWKLFVRTSATFFALSLAVVLVLFPALLMYPAYVVGKLLNAGGDTFTGGYTTVLYAQKFPLLFYPSVLLAKLSPITVVLLVMSLINMTVGRTRRGLWFIFYILTYLIVFSTADQKIERYVVGIIPPIILVISLVISEPRNATKYLLIGISLLLSLVVYTEYYPFLSAYYSPFINGVAGAWKLGLLDTNGEYYAQAAQYLNSKGRQVVVYVPSNSQSFLPYYKGVFQDRLTPQTQYVVTSIDSSRTVDDFPNCTNVEKSYTIDKVIYLTIYKCL